MKSFNEWLFSKKVKMANLSPQDVTRVARGVLFQNRKEMDELGHLDDYSKKRVRDEMEKMSKAGPQVSQAGRSHGQSDPVRGHVDH